MTILMSNTYVYDKETSEAVHVVTGFIGAFDSREKAMDVWNNTLKDFGVSEDMIPEFGPSCIIGNRFIPIDMNGKFVEDIDDAEFIIELMSKDTEMNKVWESEMAKA